MAKATKISIPIKPTFPAYTVHLELSSREAVFLRSVLRRIGGTPTNSVRKYADNIRDALANAGVGAVKLPLDEHYKGGMLMSDGNIEDLESVDGYY